MTRPLLMDLFCGAGGAAMGYYRAGFDVVGVDNRPQPRFPFRFVQADALEYVAAHGHEFDALHASPPCQAYSTTQAIWNREYVDLVEPVRELLRATGKPYVIENVPGAPLIAPLMLCGTMFGLRIIRHRLFECWPSIDFAPATCAHTRPVVKVGWRPDPERHFVAMAGHFADVEQVRQVVGIDWMTRDELAQAIPPAYTEWIGRHLMQHLAVCA